VEFCRSAGVGGHVDKTQGTPGSPTTSNCSVMTIKRHNNVLAMLIILKDFGLFRFLSFSNFCFLSVFDHPPSSPLTLDGRPILDLYFFFYMYHM
jgi:hypothetical protein